MKLQDWLDIIWVIILIILAIKIAPAVGIFAAVSVGLAGVRIGTLPLDRRIMLDDQIKH